MKKSPFNEVKNTFLFRFLSDFWKRFALKRIGTGAQRRRLWNAAFFCGAILTASDLWGQERGAGAFDVSEPSILLESAPSPQQSATVSTPRRKRANPQKLFEPPLTVPNSSNAAALRASHSFAPQPGYQRSSFNGSANVRTTAPVSNGTVAPPKIATYPAPLTNSGALRSTIPSSEIRSGASHWANSSGAVRPADFENASNRTNASGRFAPSNPIRLTGAVGTTVATDSNDSLGNALGVANDSQSGAVPAPIPVAEPELISDSSAETLAEAMELAVSASRSQQALALRTGASRSTVDAARSLAAPKITNATAYVGMANQPTVRSEVDLSGLGSAIPPALAPMFAGLPTSIDALTPVSDKDFVATTTAVTLPVYLGGRVQALTRSAEALTQAANAGEEIGEQNIKFETSEAYFLVLRTRKLHEVASEATRTAAEHLSDAERMFAVGMLTKNVVLAAQVALSEARQTELRVANAQLLSEAAYNRLLWRPLDAAVNIADVELNGPLGEFDALAARAARNRAELDALSAQSRAMREQEKVARADVLPQVALVGAYSYVENSHMTENSNATGAVGMVWTPFDGGTSRARRNAARQDALALAKARDEAESAIRLQVYQAWLAEKEARERVEVARAAVEQSEENYRVVTRGFQEGIVNHTEVLDALTLRTAAKSAFANARYDAVLAAQRAARAVGDL